jgi:hypothetical protein
MKKKLEADLISIAHKVLQMKNKSDVNQLYLETQKLYEKLSVLRFVEEHFEGAKPTIGQAEIAEKMKQFFEENHLSEIKPVVVHDEIVIEEINNQEVVTEDILVDEIEEEIVEVAEEVSEMDFEEEEITFDESEELEVSNDFGFQPAFELDVEYDEEPVKKQEAVQISFDDLLGENYSETLFVKVDPVENVPSAIAIETESAIDWESDTDQISEMASTENESKTVSLNETLSKGIKIDLNDRIAFVKHLFGNSDEDYNRVLNQLITYDSFEEAQNFIEDMVKPDYNSWEGKEDYSQRFIEIIEKKFD